MKDTNVFGVGTMLRSIKSSVSLKSAKLPFKKNKERGKTTEVVTNTKEVVTKEHEKENGEEEEEEGVGSSHKRTLSTPPGSPSSKHKRLKRSPLSPCNRIPKEEEENNVEATKTISKSPPPCSAFNRHKVLEVNSHVTEKTLLLRPHDATDDDDASHVQCVLRGSWLECRVQPGDVVNVLADWSDAACGYKVDDLTGLLVVNPDSLVSGTSVVSTLFCKRKAVLNEIFKGMDGEIIF